MGGSRGAIVISRSAACFLYLYQSFTPLTGLYMWPLIFGLWIEKRSECPFLK